MANEEHLAILKQGVEVWNKWRDENREIDPDLSGAFLSGANLSYAYLGGVNLKDSNLSGADLRTANLNMAYLVSADLNEAKLINAGLGGAKLIGAHLDGANLSGSSLRAANLRDAYLTRANLWITNFTRAYLQNADFTETQLDGAIFVNTDLSLVKGLDSVEHNGPSYISIDTLYKSVGSIPESFLRGCGVPEDFITYSRSLIARAIEFYSCFISYSHADKPFARRLHDALQGMGIRCWLDEHQLLPGHDIYDGCGANFKKRASPCYVVLNLMQPEQLPIPAELSIYLIPIL
jgi:TIR domain/Pentapeptide repeats (8 copies)